MNPKQQLGLPLLVIVIIFITLLRITVFDMIFKELGIYGTKIFETNFIKRSVTDAIVTGLSILIYIFGN